MIEILLNNWAQLILGALAVVEIYTLATPSKVDDKAVGYIRAVVLALQGRAKRRKNGN
tara:strand:- start:198 stop:371 length:174 start_codon:yes stop_codon:yes gene_type:complete